LKQRESNRELFRLYSKAEVQDILINAGFQNEINTVSRRRGKSFFHCVVAAKKGHYNCSTRIRGKIGPSLVIRSVMLAN